MEHHRRFVRIAACELQGRNGHEAARELLEKLYREQTGDSLPEICVTARGKPYFVDDPLYFSISHTNHYAFCALANSPIGIDAEELGRKVRPVMIQKALSEQELDQVNAAKDPNEAFLRLWVLKEATAKMSGDGLRGFPNHTNFSLDDARLLQWHNCILAVVAEDPGEEVYHVI